MTSGGNDDKVFLFFLCGFFLGKGKVGWVQISPRAKKRRRGNKSYVSPFPPFYHHRRRNRQSRYLEDGMELDLPNVEVEKRKLVPFPPVIGDFLFLLPEEERRRKGNYYFFSSRKTWWEIARCIFSRWVYG